MKRKRDAAEEKWRRGWTGKLRLVWFPYPNPISGSTWSGSPHIASRSLSAGSHTDSRVLLWFFLFLNEDAHQMKVVLALTQQRSGSINIWGILWSLWCWDLCFAWTEPPFVRRKEAFDAAVRSHWGSITEQVLDYSTSPINYHFALHSRVKRGVWTFPQPRYLNYYILFIYLSVHWLCALRLVSTFFCQSRTALDCPGSALCVPGLTGSPCRSACRCRSSCMRFRRTGALPPPLPSPPRWSTAGTPSTCWRRWVLRGSGGERVGCGRSGNSSSRQMFMFLLKPTFKAYPISTVVILPKDKEKCLWPLSVGRP